VAQRDLIADDLLLNLGWFMPHEAESLQTLWNELRAQDLLLASTFISFMGLSTAHLATLAGLQETLIARSPSNERLQGFMRQSLEILGLLIDNQDLEPRSAVEWYRRTSLVELGGETAEHYVSQGHSQAVRRYIESVTAGALG